MPTAHTIYDSTNTYDSLLRYDGEVFTYGRTVVNTFSPKMDSTTINTDFGTTEVNTTVGVVKTISHNEETRSIDFE